ncbi:MAG TPA: hypothetical protein PK854_04035 [Oscillospiraceae bacterium]|nr:hypothetical protein [Oscillospiraceae bacterium]HPS34416.1 hypothetical protein [Oscillospiraceae bacterium]
MRFILSFAAFLFMLVTLFLGIFVVKIILKALFFALAVILLIGFIVMLAKRY